MSEENTTTAAPDAPVVDMPSYDEHQEAMKAHTKFLDSILLPHFESLISAAQHQGMSGELTASLGEGKEQLTTARNAVDDARTALTALNQAVADAHNDAPDAATNKDYYQQD